MSDETRSYTQDNEGQTTYGNQGGPQYNNDGDVYANQGNGTQNHVGSHSIANLGSGTQNINFQRMADDYKSGLDALKNRLYPKVVERFEDFLSTAESVSAGPGTDMEERAARAHVYVALGLLNGSRPSYYSSDLIRRIQTHLDSARRLGHGRPAAAMADVVLAIVKEDFYEARAMRSGGPQAAELRHSLADLDPGDLDTLVTHLAAAEGETWKELSRRATDAGLAQPEVSDAEKPRVIAPDRPEKVRKYFTRTPAQVNPAWHMCLFGTAMLLIILGIASRSPFGLILVAAAAWVGKKGYNRYKNYREFQRAWEAAEPKPRDEELDKWLDEDIGYITRKGGRKLQLKAREDFDGGDLITSAVVVVGVADSSDTLNGRPPAVRAGKDGRVRASHYDVLVLFLTHQVISSYRCILDFASGGLLRDETRQYHYTNIVGVSSVSIPVRSPVAQLVDLLSQKENDISATHKFTLSVVNGEKLQVTTQLSGAFFETSDGKIAWRGNDHALSIIQSEVRSRNAH
jgi:hypothetical protein